VSRDDARPLSAKPAVCPRARGDQAHRVSRHREHCPYDHRRGPLRLQRDGND